MIETRSGKRGLVKAFFVTRAGCKGPGLAIARRPVRDVPGEITIERFRARGSRVDVVLKVAQPR